MTQSNLDNRLSTVSICLSTGQCPAGGKHCLDRTPSSLHVNLSSFHTCSMFLHRQIILQVTRRNWIYSNAIKGMTRKNSYIYIQRSSLQDNFMRPHGQSDDSWLLLFRAPHLASCSLTPLVFFLQIK